MAPKFLEYADILYFQRRHPKQNTVDSLKSKLLNPSKFWVNYAIGKWCEGGLNVWCIRGILRNFSALFPDANKQYK